MICYMLHVHISFRRKWHYYFQSWSTTKLDINLDKYKDGFICKGLMQAIYLVTITNLLNFLLEINP